MKVLFVEDNRRVADFVRKGLEESGHVVDYADNGRDGLFLATTASYDVMIFDRMLPDGVDGLAIIEALRKMRNKTPILILSALIEVDDRIRGLRSGGDDYLTKPFAFGELSARLDALIRRSQGSSPLAELTVGDLTMDLLTHKVMRGGKVLDLKPREFKLLEFLMRHAGQVATRTMLLERVWEYQFTPGTNVIDTHISSLRQTVDAGFERPLIHTVRGFGYRLSVDG